MTVVKSKTSAKTSAISAALSLLHELVSDLKLKVGETNVKLVVPQDLDGATCLVKIQIRPGDWHSLWFTMEYANLKNDLNEPLQLFAPAVNLNHRFKLISLELIYSVEENGRTVTISHPWNFVFLSIVKQTKYNNF